MGFGEAISTGFSNYATFTGRATRPEYWYWVLFGVLAAVVFWIIQAVISRFGGADAAMAVQSGNHRADDRSRHKAPA